MNNILLNPMITITSKESGAGRCLATVLEYPAIIGLLRNALIVKNHNK